MITKISKEDLLAILKKNRELHRGVFLEAQGNYCVAAIDELEKTLADAKAGKRFQRTMTLHAPVDETREYDRAIRMVELNANGHIDLDEMEFSQYVLDQWTWRGQFLASNRAYLSGATMASLETEASQ